MTLLAAVLASVLAAEPGGEGGALTRPPELLEFVPAEYPPDAASNAIEGSVTLEIVIDESGDVRQAVVVDAGPHPGFAPAALHAVQQFRFRPAEIDGAPAAVQIVYRYDFVLRHERQEAPLEAPLALEGRVIARDTRAPVGGARVSAGSVTVETGTDGRFTLRGVPPGEVVVVVTSPEHETLSVTESIAAGQVREVEYRIARRHTDPYQAVVRGERARREVTVRTLAAEEVRTIPGTQGDTLKVLQNLPGVARSPFGIGLLVVRGSEPSETPVYVDGVPIPQLYHFGGITSVVNADVVDSIEFFPGNFSTRFGRALGGTVDLRTRNGRRQWHGTAQLDVLDGRVEMDGPVGKGSAFAAVRRSWIDAVLAVALPRVDREASNDLRVAPRYWDWQAKLTYPVLGGRGTLFAYGSDDRLELLRASDQPGRPTFHLATQFWRVGVSHRLPLGAATNDVVLAVGRDFFDVLTGGDFGLLTDVLALSLRDALTVRILARARARDRRGRARATDWVRDVRAADPVAGFGWRSVRGLPVHALRGRTRLVARARSLVRGGLASDAAAAGRRRRAGGRGVALRAREALDRPAPVHLRRGRTEHDGGRGGGAVRLGPRGAGDEQDLREPRPRSGARAPPLTRRAPAPALGDATRRDRLLQGALVPRGPDPRRRRGRTAPAPLERGARQDDWTRAAPEA